MVQQNTVDGATDHTPGGTTEYMKGAATYTDKLAVTSSQDATSTTHYNQFSHHVTCYPANNYNPDIRLWSTVNHQPEFILIHKL